MRPRYPAVEVEEEEEGEEEEVRDQGGRGGADDELGYRGAGRVCEAVGGGALYIEM